MFDARSLTHVAGIDYSINRYLRGKHQKKYTKSYNEKKNTSVSTRIEPELRRQHNSTSTTLRSPLNERPSVRGWSFAAEGRRLDAVQ